MAVLPHGEAISGDTRQPDTSWPFFTGKEAVVYRIQAGNECYEFLKALVFGGRTGQGISRRKLDGKGLLSFKGLFPFGNRLSSNSQPGS